MSNGLSSRLESQVGSFPVPLADRNWSALAAAGVSATAGIASWSFVVGGFTAYYVGAWEGTATMIAGALIGQFLVSLAQIPPTTKYGLETLVTTKPQLGVRGSYFALFVQYATLIGWNAALLIFFGRSAASVLIAIGAISPETSSFASAASSVLATLAIWLILVRGAGGIKHIGIAVATLIVVLGAYMYVVLFNEHSVGELLAAKPISPLPDGHLTNYTTAIEILLVSTLGWWAYMGSMFRMLDSGRKALAPSMISLGFGWAAAGIIGLYSALIVGEADPTVWMTKIGGAVGGIVVLAFVAAANIGSALVGAHAAALGVGQIPAVSKRMSWTAVCTIVLIPLLLVLVMIPDLFYDNIGFFMAFIGIIIAPIIGVQIVDWYCFARLKTLDLPSLYRHNPRSDYWYTNGFNIPGVVALVLGAFTYMALLDPVTFVPNSSIFAYTTATLPSAFVGGLVYFLGSIVQKRISKT